MLTLWISEFFLQPTGLSALEQRCVETAQNHNPGGLTPESVPARCQGSSPSPESRSEMTHSLPPWAATFHLRLFISSNLSSAQLTEVC